MKTIFLFFIIILNSTAFSQLDLKLDFENDNILDFVKITNSENGYNFSYSLSSQNNKQFITEKLTLGGEETTLSNKGNILIIHVQFMRGENILKYRFSTTLKQVQLIGFNNIQYGNATQDGSGTSSYNLLTGIYEANWNKFDYKKNRLISIPKIKSKLPAKTYLLNKLNDKMLEELEDVGYNLMPKNLR